MSPSATGTDGNESSILEPIAICGMACRLPGGVDSDSSFWKMLLEKRSGQTPRVPESRFNIDAHLHSSSERPGSFNVAGGYFLDGRPEDFDPSFFNMTPIEAQWLDPQQRKMLEVSYECLVSAGITLEKASGSTTAVFVGSFTSDYQQMSTKDPDFRHNYAATGVDPGIISNRIGNAFNLNGPSFTINTACSSSVYAIHNACHALRARDCDAAIAGGVNLIVTVDQHMNTAKLGILSPTSTCHTFDASADGYGRAEGAGALYLKRLSDAIRDGDPIRGVIRATAVNTNGKVEGMGITHPSAEGQERVVRMAYQKAGLDPNLTAYAELHGTGTPVGDPIEVRAISKALNDTRPKNKPLLVGAVKPNIGHSEAASGIFAVMKAALMTESSIIPGVAYFKTLNPEILEEQWNVKVHSDTAPWPHDSTVQRASVSSFGYGGTNGHVIVESIAALHPLYQHARSKNDVAYDRSTQRPLLLCLSAHDKPTLSRVVEDVTKIIPNYFAVDLAYTLNLNRTMFSNRAFFILREGQDIEPVDPTTISTGVASKKEPGVGFLFTGQGAQWIGVGKAAMSEFPVFYDAIEKLDLILNRLRPKPNFKLTDILLGLDPIDINEAQVAQPLCTAIQIAIVDLLTYWGIAPQVSIGHSSGEIGAAYAAGLISAPEAMMTAYCRGRAVHDTASVGSMLAVGVGAEEIVSLLADLDMACISIACENSPQSVTLSGEAREISDLNEQLTSKGVFARELKTGRAYHSHHMAPVAEEYNKLLAEALSLLNENDLLWQFERTEMISSVTGEVIQGDLLPEGYWAANLRQRVRFNSAIEKLGTDANLQHITSMVEIGPHSALSGPFKQVCLANKFDRFNYIPSLVRNKNDADQLLSLSGSLFLTGYPVDLSAVNLTAYDDPFFGRKPMSRHLLVDLPPYPWNYDKQFWAEPRASAEQRARVYPRHDLLGSRVSGLSQGSKIWRNLLRHRDVPWLKDHSLGGSAIFPAAGYISVATEALRQVLETENGLFQSVTFHDVDIKAALIVPDTDDGVETIVRLETTDTPEWYKFFVESLMEGVWTLHCQGRVSAAHTLTSASASPIDEAALSQRVSGKRWYKAFHSVGFEYGKTFQQLLRVKTERSLHHAQGDIVVLDNSGVMEGESRYVLHPATIDACLQLIIVSIHSGKHKEMPWGVVPTRIAELSLNFPTDTDLGVAGAALAWTDNVDDRRFNTYANLTGQSGNLLMSIKSLTCVAFEAALPAGFKPHSSTELFSTAIWKPDITTLSMDEKTNPVMDVAALAKSTALVVHRQSITDVLLLLTSSTTPEQLETLLQVLPSTSNIACGYTGETALILPEPASVRATLRSLSSPEEWQEIDNSLDIIVNLDSTVGTTQLLGTLKEHGWVLGNLTSDSPSSHSENSALQKETNLLPTELGEDITVLSFPSQAATNYDLIAALTSASSRTVHQRNVADFIPDNVSQVVIDDRAGLFFSSLDSDSFEALKTVFSAGAAIVWLSQGVQEGQNPSGGVAEGFLRVVRSEQAATRVVLLDASHSESSQDVGRAIVEKLRTAATKDSGADTEFWLHEGILHISRIYHDAQGSEQATRIESAHTVPLPTSVPLKSTTKDGELVFEPAVWEQELGEDDIRLQILASDTRENLNWPAITIGTVTEIGHAVQNLSAGKQVVTFIQGPPQTMLQTGALDVVEIGDALSPGDVISIFSQLAKLAELTLVRTNIEVATQVLLLPGPEPMMKTAMSLATALGWNLSIAVSTEEEKIRWKAELEGRVFAVDDLSTILAVLGESASPIVIAHDFESLSQEVWWNIPNNGRFLALIDDASIPLAPDPLPFTRGASFIPLQSRSIGTSSTTSTSSLLRLCVDLVAKHPNILGKLKDSKVAIDVSNVDAEATQGADATLPILTYEAGESEIKVQPATEQLSLSSNSAYLLVGCLGGLGRSLTRRMIERGARHFVFISRSGSDKPEAAAVIESIEQAGASAKVIRADAADERAIQEVVLFAHKERPIRGVVHAAMVLKDGMFEQMNYKSFADVLDPKAKGALALHHAVDGIELDFFVMTSSISAVLGNTGQTNYSAANSFLDSLAVQRRSNGLSATSLVLPMVLDVGVVSENEAIELSLSRKGLYGIDEHEMLRGFEAAMTPQPSRSPQIIMGLDPLELARVVLETPSDNQDLYWINDARLCHIRAALYSEVESRQGSSGSNSDGGFAAKLKSALAEGPAAALEAIAEHIAKRVSSILLIPVENLELTGPSIASYGLDSMIGAEMRTWLFKEFELDIPFQKLLAPTLTFTALASLVAEKMGIFAVT